MTHPDPGVELLERALAYTRGALLHVRPHHLHRPTPCAGWDLDLLLDHMDDALDAFTEGAAGSIAADPPHRSLDVRVATLQTKACDLLGAWTCALAAGTPTTVRVGGLAVPTAVVTRAAALEITTHGWDVAQATGHRTPIPEELAADLIPVAHALVTEDDRGVRFAEPTPSTDRAMAAAQLLGFLGRSGPPGRVSHDPRTQERPAS